MDDLMRRSQRRRERRGTLRVLGLLLLLGSLAAGPVRADFPAPLTMDPSAGEAGFGSSHGGGYGHGGIMPAQFSAPGPPPPGMGPGAPGPVPPPGMGPWPQISPFEHGMERTTNVNGLWATEYRNAGRTYYASVEGLFFQTRKPSHTRIGAPGVQQIPDPIFLFATAGNVSTGFVGNQRALRTDLINEKSEDPMSLGFGLKFGWEDHYGTGVEFSGFFLPEAEFSFSRGVAPFLGNNPADSRRTAALPLIDGTPGGAIADYDRFFGFQIDTVSGGAGVKFFMTPKYDTGIFKLRGFSTLRYVFIREGFNFNGFDSGLGLVYDADGTPIVQTAIPLVPSYFGTLSSQVESHIAGPQLGLRYSVGGDNFRIWGDLAAGLGVNAEDISLNGQGIGDGFAPGFDQQRLFSDNDSAAHVSGIFDFSVNAEMNILGGIPVIKRMKTFEEAKLRIGYQFLGITEVARPYDIIVWQGQPRNPFIRNRRSEWYTHGLTVSFDWRF